MWLFLVQILFVFTIVQIYLVLIVRLLFGGRCCFSTFLVFKVYVFGKVVFGNL